MTVKPVVEDTIIYKIIGGKTLKTTTMACNKPNCNCLEIAEEKAGGPVKNCPCLDTEDYDQYSKLKKVSPSMKPQDKVDKKRLFELIDDLGKDLRAKAVLKDAIEDLISTVAVTDKELLEACKDALQMVVNSMYYKHGTIKCKTSMVVPELQEIEKLLNRFKE